MTGAAARPAVLFVESSTSGTDRLFVRAARTLGYVPVLATARPERYPWLREEGAPEVMLLPRVDEDALYAALLRRFGHDGLAGVTSSSECHEATAASAARGAAAAAREVGFPVVVKPVDGSGSVGVRACADAAEVEAHAAALLAPGTAASRLLVEERVEGAEFSVELFSGRVVGITRKHLGSLPAFVETGHDYPADVSPALAGALSDTVTRATALLGLGWGPLHWEVRVRDGVAVPIEVNPRLAGGFIPELVRHAQGIDLIRETLRLVVGRAPRLIATARRHASIRFLLAPGAGRLAAVQGRSDALRRPGVVEVRLYRRVGDTLSLHGDFRDRIGHVIACADGLDAAARAAERARAAIGIGVEAEGETDEAADDGTDEAAARLVGVGEGGA